MTATHDDTVAGLQRTIGELRRERDTLQAREATLGEALAARDAALAQRNSEYSERIDQQLATIDVLKAMSAALSDTQPVFDLIVRHAAELCNGSGAGLLEFDGELVHYRSSYGLDPDATRAYAAIYPMPPTRSSIACRAILDKQIIHIRDMDAEPSIIQAARNLGIKSNIALPLMRDDTVIGVFVLDADETGGFSDSQIALLQTFAEQAAIAITSAETYRKLQTRTDLEQSLDYQTATSDVLKVISRSAYDLKAVLQVLLDTAARLCAADFGALMIRDGDVFRTSAIIPISPEHEAFVRRKVFVPSPHGSVVERTAFARQITHTEDIATLSDYVTSGRGFVVSGTALGVPLFLEGNVVGVFTLHRQRTEPFTDAQIELVSTFADQAVIAIENTRLITEQQEALEQQTATAEVLQAINASPGNLTPVFDAMLEKAMRLCDVAFGGLATFDGKRFTPVALRGVPAAYADYRMHNQASTAPETITGRIIHGENLLHITDLMMEEAYRIGDPDRRAIVDLGGARTSLAVALRKDEVLLGMIQLYRQEVRPFNDRQVALLQNFAAQGVIAMENARLITETREALEQQTATAEVLQVINASPGDLAPVFDAILEKAHRLCGAAHGALVLRDGDGETFRAVATHSYSGVFGEQLRQGYRGAENPITRSLIGGARFVHHPDLAQIDHPMVRASVELAGVRTGLYVPLRKDGVLLGMISSARRDIRPFSDKEIALVENFAAQAVIAMENARLITEQREALEQQTATAEVLQVINTSPGNLAPVFDAILEKAHSLIGGVVGALVLYEGPQFRAVATHGFSEQHDAMVRQLHGPTPGHLELLAGARFKHYHDLRSIEDRQHDAVTRSHVENNNARTALWVPLRKDDRLLGLISVYRLEVRPFLEKEIALLENFAAQAVIAMENARLLTEQREALEQQTATAEVLQVINASPGDLVPVFDAMLERALRLCGAAIGGVYRYSGQRFETVALLGVTPAFQEYNDKYPMREVRPGSLPARMIETRGPVQNPDVLASETYRAGSPYARALAELGGIRAVLDVPLLKGGALLGFIAIYREEAGAFSDKQIALLEDFAAQAVIAMENARLITEQREALEQQTATAEVLQVINANPGNLSPVFDAILDKAHTLCGAAIGSLVLFDGTYFRAVTTHGWPNSITALFSEPTGPNRARQRLVDGERFVQVPDIRAIGRGPNSAWGDAVVESTDARTMLLVPLRKDGALLGFISAFRPGVRAFADKEIALMENFAAQAVIAMENARLLTETREALEQQTATAEVLQVINASPGNLTPVFDAILEKARILCEATYGGLMLRDEEGFRIVAARGAAPFVEAWRQLGPIRPPPGAWSERLIRGDTTIVHVIDVRADDIYSTLPTEIRQLYELGGIRTYLVAPLRKDDTILGLIILFRQEVRPFTDKQIALLQNFASQAVIAIENARLLDEIRQRQAELRTTFDNMGDGVAMFDTDLRLAAWNRNFQRIIDLPDTLLETRPGYADYLRLPAERGEFGTTDIEAELSLRIEVVIEARRNAVPGGGFVLIYSDITERKRSEEEIRAARDAAETALRELKTAQANLIQAEKMASLGQLTAGIAHEIKNPLNFVNNFAALSVDLLSELKETAAPGFAALTEKQRAEVEEVSVMLTSNLEKITEHGKRADGIVKAMLEHSRGSSGERRKVDLNTLIDEALNLAYHGARAQDQSFNITLERDFGAGIGPIEVNPQDLTRVFLNLFANGFYATTRRARDAADAGFEPTLKVTTRDDGEAVEIRVRDNGTGIPADIRDKLFQPFFTTKPTGEGTGLGLSITYDIVTQQHGGNIAADSKVGEYSEFAIRLPRNP